MHSILESNDWLVYSFVSSLGLGIGMKEVLQAFDN